MYYLMIAVIAVVVFGVAAVAAGQGGTLGEVGRDPWPLAGHEGPLRGTDVADVRFPVVLRGYRMDNVDAVLDRLGAELDARDARIAELEGGGSQVAGPAAAGDTDSRYGDGEY